MNSLNNPPNIFRHNVHSKKGQIQVIFGPMFSGKTTELLRRIKRYQCAKYKCVVIKYENDKRYDKNDISTHDRVILIASASEAPEHRYIDVGISPFGTILNLVPIAESVVKLSAVCMNCYDEGSFTQRICNDTKLELIGGADLYMATCRDCHEKLVAADAMEQEIIHQQNRKPLSLIDNICSRGVGNAKENVAS